MRVIVTDKEEEIPKESIDGKPTYVYWDIIGLAQGGRLAMAVSGIDYVEVRIASSKEGGEAWYGAKPDLHDAMSFPNLPCYFDTSKGVSLTQSDAILRYLGRTYDIYGDAGQEHVVDMCLDELKDLESGLGPPSYQEGLEAVVAWYQNTAAPKIKLFEKLLGSNTYLTGSKLSIADLKLYQFLKKMDAIQEQSADRGIAAPHEGLKAYMSRIEEIPALKAYMSTKEYMTRPLNYYVAKFNN